MAWKLTAFLSRFLPPLCESVRIPGSINSLANWMRHCIFAKWSSRSRTVSPWFQGIGTGTSLLIFVRGPRLQEILCKMHGLLHWLSNPAVNGLPPTAITLVFPACGGVHLFELLLLLLTTGNASRLDRRDCGSRIVASISYHTYGTKLLRNSIMGRTAN